MRENKTESTIKTLIWVGGVAFAACAVIIAVLLATGLV